MVLYLWLVYMNPPLLCATTIIGPLYLSCILLFSELSTSECLYQESGNFLLPLLPPLSALSSCIRQKREEKKEQKESNVFLFLLMRKRQKKEEKGASPSFFSQIGRAHV